MQLNDLCEFIAKQLNDHESQCHGVSQGTYTTWTKDHILEAVKCALAYVYSINSAAFPTAILQLTQPKDSCYIDFSCVGCKVLEVIKVGGDACDNTVEQTADNTISLLGMLNASCLTVSGDMNKQYALRKLANDKYVADSIIPEGTEIDFLCTSPPDDDDISPALLAEYKALIVNFALWQLLLTDNESRSNQPRWEAYFKGLQWFVETKLLLEFSLNEDDYLLGRRRVDDK